MVLKWNWFGLLEGRIKNEIGRLKETREMSKKIINGCVIII